MTNSLQDSSFRKKSKNVREAIIMVLSKAWPLTARKIYNNIRKDGFSITYQAVHKVLKEMVGDEILLKEGTAYSIRPDWLENKKKYYDIIIDKISNDHKPSNEEVVNSELTKLEFTCLYEYYVRILDLFYHIAEMPYPTPAESEGPISAHLYHMYWIFSATDKNDKDIRFIMKHSPESFFICNGNTTTDRLIAKYFNELGINVKTGVSCAEACDIFTGGGFVIQTFFPKNLKKDLDKIFGNFEKNSTANIISIFDRMYHNKTDIQVIISKNPKLEKQIYEETKSYFM